eukprot:6194466-Pleurochrysis_carterae.AAC.2
MASRGRFRSFWVLRRAEHHTFGCIRNTNLCMFRVVPRWRATSLNRDSGNGKSARHGHMRAER